MTDADATRLSGNNADATRLAGESYRTRLAPNAASDDETRIAQQEGYQSKLARDAINNKPDDSEFYKIGNKIGDRYEVSAIHHGAMGVVYGCFDHVTKLPRALKTVRSRHLHDKQVLSMFENEAAVWISLEKHPYIVRAYLVERFNNLPYVITEYVRGPEGMEGDLRGWLGHPRLTLKVAVEMALQIAQGMQHAVRKVPNLVHRDLKPANILVGGDGKAMVTDFGLVDSAQAGAGTPAYMSPEQWREEPLDVRSDIYAYGCILFEMFTSHRLFPAQSEESWKQAHLESIPTSLTSLTPELPCEIDLFVRHCLEKNVANRPQSWDEIVSFFAAWYHQLTEKAVVIDFSSLGFDAGEWVNASYSLDKLKRYTDALEASDKALAFDNMNSEAWVSKGRTLNKLNRYKDSIDACNNALAINRNDAYAWFFKCIAFYNLKQYAEATYANEQAFSLGIIDPQAYLFKGNIFLKLQCYDEAFLAYDQASEIDPKFFFSWYIKGLVLRDLNRFDEAIDAIDNALAREPNNVDTLINKGVILDKLKRYEDALAVYERVLIIDADNDAAYSNMGNILGGLNRNEEAIHAFDRALAINPKGKNTWHNKGCRLLKLDRYKESICAFDRALAIDPNFTESQSARRIVQQKIAQEKIAQEKIDNHSQNSFWQKIFGK